MQHDSQSIRVPSDSARKTAIPQLDTIRVAAMLGIFLHHLWKTVIPTAETTIQSIINPIFATASDGVIVFNIISGFLLALPHLGPERRPFQGYGTFFRKRLLRVIPPYYLALAVFTIGNILRFGVPLSAAMDTLVQHLLFVNSLDYANMFSNFSHFWYLGQLAQFYLLFPLVLGFFIWAGPARAVFSIIILCWGSWIFLAWCCPSTAVNFPDTAEKLMHFNLPGRLPEFAIGMWLASLWRSPAASEIRLVISKKPFAPFAAAMVLYVIVGMPLLSTMNLAFLHIWHVALTIVVLLLLLVWAPAARVGGVRIAKHVAEHSYSIYIVHIPVFSYVGVMPSEVTHSIGNFVLLTVLLLPLCYLAAVILDQLSSPLIKTISRK